MSVFKCLTKYDLWEHAFLSERSQIIDPLVSIKSKIKIPLFVSLIFVCQFEEHLLFSTILH